MANTRKGSPVLYFERLIAAMRVDAGDDIAVVAADYRVSVATVKQWIEKWTRQNRWTRGGEPELVSMETDAGYQLVVLEREEQRGQSHFVVRVERGRDWSRARVLRAIATGHRELFVELIEDLAELDVFGQERPQIEAITRTYGFLDEHSRSEFAPVWDLFLIAVGEIESGLEKLKRTAALIESATESEAA